MFGFTFVGMVGESIRIAVFVFIMMMLIVMIVVAVLIIIESLGFMFVVLWRNRFYFNGRFGILIILSPRRILFLVLISLCMPLRMIFAVIFVRF
jgi:hypothetical protein